MSSTTGPRENDSRSGLEHEVEGNGSEQDARAGAGSQLERALRQLVVSLKRETKQLTEEKAQLEEALDSRIVIEQAKGILAERYSLSIEDAFRLLRYTARTSRTEIHEFARKVVEPDEAASVAVINAVAIPGRWRRPLPVGAGPN